MSARLNLHRGDDGQVVSVGFVCPGCGGYHEMGVRKVGDAPVWSWNGDTEHPTLSPSVLFANDHPTKGPGAERCHSFVREGRIQFLGDCTHSLAGQTVDLLQLEGDSDA